MPKSKSNVYAIIGFWAFILGLVIAVIAGLIQPQTPVMFIILIILGIIIGLLNITGKEIMLFLIATIAIIIMGNVFIYFNVLDIGKILSGIMTYLAVLMSPAAIIAAIKALWSVGKPGD